MRTNRSRTTAFMFMGATAILLFAISWIYNSTKEPETAELAKLVMYFVVVALISVIMITVERVRKPELKIPAEPREKREKHHELDPESIKRLKVMAALALTGLSVLALWLAALLYNNLGIPVFADIALMTFYFMLIALAAIVLIPIMSKHRRSPIKEPKKRAPAFIRRPPAPPRGKHHWQTARKVAARASKTVSQAARAATTGVKTGISKSIRHAKNSTRRLAEGMQQASRHAKNKARKSLAAHTREMEKRKRKREISQAKEEKKKRLNEKEHAITLKENERTAVQEKIDAIQDNIDVTRLEIDRRVNDKIYINESLKVISSELGRNDITPQTKENVLTELLKVNKGIEKLDNKIEELRKEKKKLEEEKRPLIKERTKIENTIRHEKKERHALERRPAARFLTA